MSKRDHFLKLVEFLVSDASIPRINAVECYDAANSLPKHLVAGTKFLSMFAIDFVKFYMNEDTGCALNHPKVADYISRYKRTWRTESPPPPKKKRRTEFSVN